MGKSQIGEQRNDLPDELMAQLQAINNMDTNAHTDTSNKKHSGFKHF